MHFLARPVNLLGVAVSERNALSDEGMQLACLYAAANPIYALCMCTAAVSICCWCTLCLSKPLITLTCHGTRLKGEICIAHRLHTGCACAQAVSTLPSATSASSTQCLASGKVNTAQCAVEVITVYSTWTKIHLPITLSKPYQASITTQHADHTNQHLLCCTVQVTSMGPTA